MSDAAPSAARSSAAQPIPTKPAQVLARTSSWSTKLAANATYLFYGSEGGSGGVHRVPLDGSTAPYDLSAIEDVRGITLLGDDVVWLGAHPVGPGKDPKSGIGVFRCKANVDKEKPGPAAPPPPIHTVRNGSIAALKASATEIFLAEKVEHDETAILRITGPTVARIAELDGRIDSIAIDATHAYIATSSKGSSMIVRAARLPDEVKAIPISRQLAEIKVVGDDIISTGYGARFELFRSPKSSVGSGSSIGDGGVLVADASASHPLPLTSLASDLMTGYFAVSGDQIYFLTGRSRNALLQRVPITGGPATVVSKIVMIDVISDLLVTEDAAYIAGREDQEAGLAGIILKLPLR